LNDRLELQTLQCTICREGQKPKFIQAFALARPPVIRLLLVIQVPHTRDKSSPCFLEGGEDVVCVVFCGNRHMWVMLEPPPPTRMASA
jgi:hypothetical protein